MRTAPKVIAVVTAAAILSGLTGLASVANAAQPSTATGVAVTQATTTDDEMSASTYWSTRQFTITNFSGHTLRIDDIWGTTGWPYPKNTGFNAYDEFPLAGSVLKPGQQMKFEIKDWSDHGITVRFKAENGENLHVYMHVSGVSRYSDAKGLEGQFMKGGGDVTIFDKPGVVTVPASDPAGQARTMNTLCDQSAVECTFQPTDKKGGFFGPAHAFGRGVANLTPDSQVSHITEGDSVESSTSLELSASVKATIFGSLEMGLTTTYKQAWTASHTFTQSEDLTVRPGWVAWLTAQEPMIRVTGDLTIKMKGSKTEWKLPGLVFDVPDKFATDNGGKAGLIGKFSREMTEAEVKEAWDTGGFVVAPWKIGRPAAFEVLQMPDSGPTGTDSAALDLDGSTVLP
jgi:hypothetical protein